VTLGWQLTQLLRLMGCLCSPDHQQELLLLSLHHLPVTGEVCLPV
jgi:hypothetical protein